MSKLFEKLRLIICNSFINTWIRIHTKNADPDQCRRLILETIITCFPESILMFLTSAKLQLDICVLCIVFQSTKTLCHKSIHKFDQISFSPCHHTRTWRYQEYVHTPGQTEDPCAPGISTLYLQGAVHSPPTISKPENIEKSTILVERRDVMGRTGEDNPPLQLIN